MLTNPNATYTNPMTGGTTPVSPNAWYMFGKQVDCDAILSVFQKQNTAAKVRLIDEIASGQALFYSKPDPNPDGISIWHLVGTVPGPNDAQGNPTTLQIDEYAGWLFDRGNAPDYGGKPDESDTNGEHGGIGGPFLTYSAIGNGWAQLRWSETQNPVLTDPVVG